MLVQRLWGQTFKIRFQISPTKPSAKFGGSVETRGMMKIETFFTRLGIELDEKKQKLERRVL
jgi:hypothetical protein